MQISFALFSFSTSLTTGLNESCIKRRHIACMKGPRCRVSDLAGVLHRGHISPPSDKRSLREFHSILPCVLSSSLVSILWTRGRRFAAQQEKWHVLLVILALTLLSRSKSSRLSSKASSALNRDTITLRANIFRLNKERRIARYFGKMRFCRREIPLHAEIHLQRIAM